MSSGSPSEASRAGSTSSGTGLLDGVTVVDLTRVLAGPFCTLLLADLGARVIKVERPGRGDDARSIGPFVSGQSAYFASLNRGKQSVALDLGHAADLEILDRLLGRADVLVENFRPGALERLGLGWDALHARHPRLVLASVSGFGQSGPLRERPAYDVVEQAMGGIMSVTGQPGGAPTRVGSSIGDLSAGLFAALGVAAALQRRHETGQGVHLDVSMLDCQVALLENAIARTAATGQAPGPLGSRHPSIAPFAAFAAADGHLVIAAGNDGLFARLARVLEREEWLGDPRFATNPERTRHADALAGAIEEALAAHPVEHWLARLDEAGIPCGPLLDVAQVMAHPQVRARNMIVSAEDARAGTLQMAGNPIKVSGVEDPPRRGPVPELDGDREALLAELGLVRGTRDA